MLINIVCIESSRPDWSKQAFESYQSKFNKSVNIQWKGCKPVLRNKSYDIDKAIKKESELLLAKTKKEDLIICLDKEGKSFDTLKLKQNFDSWISSSKDISFLVGGPDGLSSECIRRSHLVWSLSGLTFPHSLIPVLLIEQIYRVWSITQNHPYHR